MSRQETKLSNIASKQVDGCVPQRLYFRVEGDAGAVRQYCAAIQIYGAPGTGDLRRNGLNLVCECNSDARNDYQRRVHLAKQNICARKVVLAEQELNEAIGAVFLDKRFRIVN